MSKCLRGRSKGRGGMKEDVKVETKELGARRQQIKTRELLPTRESYKDSLSRMDWFLLESYRRGKYGTGLGNGDIYLLNKYSRRIKRLSGHKGLITSLLVLKRGNGGGFKYREGKLASGSYDKCIKIWDLRRERLEVTLHLHNDWVISLCSLPGDRVASSSMDQTVLIWKQDTYEQISLIPFLDIGHPISLIFANISNMLVDVSTKESCKLYSCNLNTYLPVREYTPQTTYPTRQSRSLRKLLCLQPLGWIVLKKDKGLICFQLNDPAASLLAPDTVYSNEEISLLHAIDNETGRICIGTGRGSIVIWDIFESGRGFVKRMKIFDGQIEYAASIGNTLLLGSNKVLRLIDWRLEICYARTSLPYPLSELIIIN